MEEKGDADVLVVVVAQDQHGLNDAEAKTERKRPPLNFSQKMALAFLGIFMGIVATLFILYICIFLILFKNIFELENMVLVFCTFLFTCLLYITCCIVGMTVIIQANNKKHLNLFQVAMIGIIFLNVLSPTLTLQSSFHECFAKPKMVLHLPCPQLCGIRASITAMTGLAVLCIILKIVLHSLWDEIQEKDPYLSLYQDEAQNENQKLMLESYLGFDGMIPTFFIDKSEAFTFSDTKESKEKPSDNNELVIILPEHADRVRKELAAAVKKARKEAKAKRLSSSSGKSLRKGSKDGKGRTRHYRGNKSHKSAQTIETTTTMEPVPILPKISENKDSKPTDDKSIKSSNVKDLKAGGSMESVGKSLTSSRKSKHNNKHFSNVVLKTMSSSSDDDNKANTSKSKKP